MCGSRVRKAGRWWLGRRPGSRRRRSMSQVKIYGLREHLAAIIPAVSDAIHSCVVDALEYPKDKRAHRFFPLDRSEFFYPSGRTDKYTIVEFSMFEGRSVEAKKKLIRLMFERFERQLAITPQ